MKTYLPIGAGRLLDIIVYYDDEKIYEGMVEDAPEEIKQLKYSKVELSSKMTYYVYSESKMKEIEEKQ